MIVIISFFVIVLACAFQAAALMLKSKQNILRTTSGFAFASGGILLVFGEFVRRSVEIKFPAVTNMYESLVFFSACISLGLAVYLFKAKDKALGFVVFGTGVIAVSLLAIALSPAMPKEVLPPIPVLRSGWLAVHVVFAFIGEAFFAAAFTASIYYLLCRNSESLPAIDRVIYTCIGIGYPVFTAGALVFGAIWAESAWGRYWSWDPKETWALITWAVYTIYLHIRFVKKWRGQVSAVISIIGFIVTLFTLFGVNYILSGLHSYSN